MALSQTGIGWYDTGVMCFRMAQASLFRAAPFALIFSACSGFNLPVQGGLFAVGASSSPRVSLYRLSGDRNSLTLISSADPGFAVTSIAFCPTAIAASGSSHVNVGPLKRTLTFGTAVSLGVGLISLALHPGCIAVYVGTTGGAIEVRSVSGGALGTSLQTHVHTGVDMVTGFGFFSSGLKLILVDDGGGDVFNPHLIDVGSDGRLGSYGSPTPSVFSSGMFVSPWAGVNSSSFFMADDTDAYLATGTTFLGLTGAVSSGGTTTAVAGHPTEPWAISAVGSTLRRYVLTGTTMTFSGTTTVTGTTLGLAFDSSGTRLVRLTSSTLVLYSVTTDGTLTQLSSHAVTGGAALAAQTSF